MAAAAAAAAMPRITSVPLARLVFSRPSPLPLALLLFSALLQPLLGLFRCGVAELE